MQWRNRFRTISVHGVAGKHYLIHRRRRRTEEEEEEEEESLRDTFHIIHKASYGTCNIKDFIIGIKKKKYNSIVTSESETQRANWNGELGKRQMWTLINQLHIELKNPNFGTHLFLGFSMATWASLWASLACIFHRENNGHIFQKKNPLKTLDFRSGLKMTELNWTS